MKKWLIVLIFLGTPELKAQIMGEELVPQRPDMNGIVVLPDGRRCRGVIEVNAQGKEYTRLVECEGVILQAPAAPLEAVAKPKKPKGFTVEDGDAHYAIKLGYSLDPKAAFREVVVGNTRTKADINYGAMPVLEFEYGFYNKYAWNFVAGAGLDFEKRATVTQYNFGTIPIQPRMIFSSLNLYLNLYRAFERFYVQLGGMYSMPQITFDQSTSSQGAGGIGYRIEVGYSINSRWAVYGSYRDFALSVTAKGSAFDQDFVFKQGKYTDFIVGARYLFR